MLITNHLSITCYYYIMSNKQKIRMIEEIQATTLHRAHIQNREKVEVHQELHDKNKGEEKVNQSFQKKNSANGNSQQVYETEYYIAMIGTMDEHKGALDEHKSAMDEHKSGSDKLLKSLQTNNVLLRTIIFLLCALIIVLIYFALCGIQIREIPHNYTPPKYPKYNDYDYNNPFSNSVSSIDINSLTNHTKDTLLYVSKSASEWYSKFSTTNNTTKSQKRNDTNWSSTYDCSNLFSALSLSNITFHHETVLSTLGYPLATFLKRTKKSKNTSQVNATT